MNVSIKSFEVEMKIKNNGIELEVSDTNNKHLGDLFITKTQLIWCKGKRGRKTGITINWDDFIKYMQNDKK
jgi:hypothetical protein